MHITQKCCISIKSAEKVSTIKKGKQLAYDICSFCLIVEHRLKPAIFFLSVGRTSFFLFELYANRSYMKVMKVKFMHNLLKLAPIYHLK